MGAIWKIYDIRSVGLLVGSFVSAGIYMHSANEFDRAAENERTTITLDVNMTHRVLFGLRGNYYSCRYSFEVGNDTYNGYGDCPQQSADEVKEGIGKNIVVYYNPSNPSLNSLIEFRVASENCYRYSVPWICVGGLCIAFGVLGAVLTSSENKRKGGVVIDARGTVIYPDEIGLGSEFAGLPNREAANSAPSPGLREQYLEVVNTIHPDRAANEADLALRERLMKEANAAFERGDAETLRKVLEEYRDAIPAS